MKALAFHQAEDLYSSVRHRSLHYFAAYHPLFETYCQKSRELQRLLGETASDSHWSDFLRVTKRFRFQASSTPLTFSAPQLAPVMTSVQIRSLVSRTAFVYPSFHSLAQEVANSLLQLMSSDDNPLLECVKAIPAEPDSRTALVLKDNRLLEATTQSLSSIWTALSLEVVSCDSLRAPHVFDRLIFVGPPSWFPDHVYSATRAPELFVVSYRWYKNHWNQQRVFRGASPTTEQRASLEQASSAADGVIDENWPTIDWAGMANRTRTNHTDIAVHELVSARLYALSDRHMAFLESEPDTTCLIIDPHDENSKVKRVQTRELDRGMYILLRTEGGGDYIAPVADRRLGERAARYRAAQQHWKQLLRQQARRSGLLAVSLRLIDLGSERANETNVRNWVSERSIGTQAKMDFLAICRLVGIEAQSEDYWKIIHEIRKAHLWAGGFIRRRLLLKVASVDTDDLERRGRMDFSLSEAEGGQLAAFRIEDIAPETTLVPPSEIGRPFVRED